MKRVNVDTAPSEVKQFIRSLALDTTGVEVPLGGKIVCKIVPPGQLSDTDKAAQFAQVRQLLGTARANSKRVPAPIVERNIRNALKTVRGGR